MKSARAIVIQPKNGQGSFRCRGKQNRKGNLGRLVYNEYIAIPNVDDEYAKTQYDLTNARKRE